MIKKCKQNINLDKNHLIKKFKNIFLNVEDLELRVMNKKLIGTYWPEGHNTMHTFLYNIPEGMLIDFILSKKNTIQGLTVKSFNKDDTFLLSNLKHLYNLIQGINLPYQKIVQIYGTGFKFNVVKDFPYKNDIIEVYAGFNNKRELILPKNVYVDLIDINTLKLISNDKDKISLISDKLKRIKPINKYKLRGIKLEYEKFVPKTYKKK